MVLPPVSYTHLDVYKRQDNWYVAGLNGTDQVMKLTLNLPMLAGKSVTYYYNGEHATSVNGTGHPTVEDMITVGVKNKMKEKRCREIYEEDVYKRHVYG